MKTIYAYIKIGISIKRKGLIYLNYRGCILQHLFIIWSSGPIFLIENTCKTTVKSKVDPLGHDVKMSDKLDLVLQAYL